MNSRNFSFFLTEILHQGNIARANPRASPHISMQSRFFALQTSLARFETRFGFCGALFFLMNSRNFSFFLTEILHQGNIARANPRASPHISMQ
ncbi:hypothetical protein KXZ74_25730, partial [Escherichia coli]|nr:hypothetical protein [Escherichia coli]